MYFYRPIQKLRALTFDLDDTLYNNQPIINRAEHESIQFLKIYHPSLNNLQQKDYQQARSEIFQQEPNICHHVSHWRRKSIELAIRKAGLSEHKARIGANTAMEIIMFWRSKISIPEETHKILEALGSRWPLVVITNGNASPEAFGLEGYFTHILRAGKDGRAKPWKDMYQLASVKLNIPPQNILHVGDDLVADIIGAIRYGMQACWVNDKGGSVSAITNPYLVPNLEISTLSSLRVLL